MKARLISLVGLAMAMALLGSCKKPSAPPPVGLEVNGQSNRTVTSRAPPAGPARSAPRNIGQSGPPPSAVMQTNGGRLLKVKWPVGYRYIYRLDLEQSSTNQAPRNPAPKVEHVAMGVSYGLAVREGNADGVRELEMQFLAYELE